MSTDALVVLKDDHAEVKRLFRAFEKADDPQQRGELVEQIIAKLKLHTEVENTILYPAIMKTLPDLKDEILESYEEHHAVDLIIAEIEKLEPTAENFEARVTVLIENVEHHIGEEEDEWFPKVRKALGRDELLQEWGEQMLSAMQEAQAGLTLDLTEEVNAPR
jgi:hemerythrin-like domain-containing protein